MPSESLKATLFYFRYIFFVIGVYFLILQNKKNILEKLYVVLFLSFFLIFISTIIHLLIDLYYDLGESQISGIFFSEKISGTYVAYLFPILQTLSISNKDFLKRIKNLTVIIFLISLFIVMISGQRSALVLFIFSNIILFIGLKEYRKKIFINKYLLIFFIFFLFLFFSINSSISKRIFNQTIEQIYNNGDIVLFSKHHESHYITSMKMFNQNKIFGVGPRLFRELCDHDNYKYYYNKALQYDNTGNPARIEGRVFIKFLDGCSTHPHNIIIQVLAETGIIGFLFIFSLISYMWIDFYKNYKFNKYNIITYGFLTSLVTIFFPFIPSNNFFSSFFGVYIFFSISFWISLKYLK
tara:strand:+ start:1473 stop:2531 length:1059 start_codon:yes stop_codon:yes gene_type:complete